MDSLSILIVDDDREIGDLIAHRIGNESPLFSIAVVESGQDCLDYLKSHQVDCIISDYQMSGMDGMDILNTLRSSGDTTPFIFITAQGNEDLAREAFKNGAYDYFTKESGFAHFPRIANSIEQAVRHHSAEKEKRQANESFLLFSDVLNKSNDAIFVSDTATGRLLFANDKACNDLGYDRDVLLTKSVMDVEERFSEKDAWDAHVKAIKSQGYVIQEGVNRRGDGSLFPVEVNATYTTVGNNDYIVAVIRDISERKKAEEALLEEKNKLDSILGNIGDVISIHDTDFRVLYQNSANRELFGEHLGELCYMAYHNLDDICYDCKVARCFDDGKPHILRRYIQKDNGNRYIEIKASPIRDSSGRIIAAVESGRDVTESKLASEALSKSLSQQKAILNNIPHMAWLKDKEGRFIAVNEALSKAFGFPPEDIVGKTEYDFFDVTAADRCLETDAETVRSGNRSIFEETVISKDGHIVVMEVIKTPVLDDAGDVIGMVGIAGDVTESRDLERRKADFYAMLSHDLKSPIASIIGFADILKDKTGNLDMEGHDNLAAIHRSGVKLMNLVEDFLAVSRIESGNLSLNPLSVDMTSLLHESMEEFTAIARNKGVDMKFDVNGGIKGVVDRKLVTRAVSNLVNNALKYTQPGGSITVGGAKANGSGAERVSISVSDTGPGIPAEEHAKVFNKYYRLTEDARLKGSGLGLYIVKVITEAHGGHVELESEIGKGSTFRMILPAS